MCFYYYTTYLAAIEPSLLDIIYFGEEIVPQPVFTWAKTIL